MLTQGKNAGLGIRELLDKPADAIFLLFCGFIVCLDSSVEYRSGYLHRSHSGDPLHNRNIFLGPCINMNIQRLFLIASNVRSGLD
ncbi:hypothetical protein BDV28DRAFT_17877 [Aspergillus coremiiformis]|uniref:Uncharacterized protein n=1 Tax=Aspergillus coremiiformis TaxID=138285 RepID=A0A5N6Z1N9_9EURO|nr:hypothetical protein BDV28DRAFT_17877 [Aspergillus coremiiformis]